MPLLHDHVCGCRRAHHFEGFSSADAPLHFPPDLTIEPTHLDIDLAVDVAGKRASGTVTTTALARQAGPRTLTLDAVDFAIESVADPGGHPLTYTYDGAKLAITWDEPFSYAEQRQVAVTYSVHEPVSGLFFSSPDPDYPDAARYAATDHETERARHWLPCVDLPNVRPTLAFHLRADASFSILANGELEGEDDHGDGTKTAHWRLDYPCPSYITCFAIGDFARADDGEFEGLPIAYFGDHERTEENLLRTFGRTGEMLAWMTEKLGQPFPYPKYFQFALPGFGGAMENISLVSWDDIFVLDETLAREWTWLIDQINVHEMAHSYFGDAIVCRDFAHAWLKESWATYMESCWLEHRHGDDELLYDFWRNRNAYFTEADGSYKRPIVTNKYDTSWHLYDRHLYPGGGARLHMLRKKLGDDVFWEGVRAYVARFMGQNVETDDFRKTLEDVSGRQLVRFFDQWFLSPGYPALKATYSFDAEKKTATFALEQTQTEDAFHMDVEVGWVLDGELHTTTVPMTSKKAWTTVSLPSEPEMVRVDPHNELVIKLEFNPGDALLRAQLTGAPDVIGRIDAAHELAKKGGRTNLDALDAAYRDEPFWGVRDQLARALAGTNTRRAGELLAGWLALEQDPLVLEHLVRAAGALRERPILDALLDRLDGGLPYRAAEAAYAALGAWGDDAPFDLLVEASTQDHHAVFPEAGALTGLAKTRRAEAAAPITARTPYGSAPHRTRAAAARALGQLAKYLDARGKAGAVDALEDLLRDPIDRVRQAAATGLVSAGARGSASRVAALRSMLSHQEQVDLDRQLATLRADSEPGVKALTDQVDELRKKVRELAEQLDKLEQTQTDD